MLSREQTIRDIARLRRAQGRAPGDEDLAAVREDLERAVGPTVARAAAARLLGVSQTALDRWVTLGEIPVVTTPRGRREVPLPPLLDLLAAVEKQRRSAEDPHALGTVLRERRARAARLTARTLLPPAAMEASGHRPAELRSLAYHRAVAQRLDDETTRDALARVHRWRAEGRIHPRYADAWETLLTGPRTRLVHTLREDSEQAAALRQSSPLAGTLDEQTRRRVIEVVAEATA
jgi:hypothetical protein